MTSRLAAYDDFEGIMIRLAGERGWQFKFAGEHVPLQTVFNHSTFAPPLLAAAKAELEARKIPCDLFVRFEGEHNSIFGARVCFDDSQDSLYAQFWRFAATALIVESLSKSGNYIELDPLQYVFGDRFVAYIGQDSRTPEAE